MAHRLWAASKNSPYRDVSDCHKGAGTIRLSSIIGHETFKTNFHGVSRGEIPPGTSIGEHIHQHMEEMFIILNAPAQFTVNGKTAELPAGSCVACLKGQSHGIYNHTDTTLQWLYFAVTETKGKGDAIDYGEDLTKKKVVSPPPFLWTNLDRRLLRPAYNSHRGKGKSLFRRMWRTETFKTNWEFLDHCFLMPGSSVGLHQHNVIEEVYYIVSGKGRMTVNDHTFDVGPGDAVPCTQNDSHGLWNNGRDDIEFIVCSCGMGQNLRNTVEWDDDLIGK
ncbi:cupin domain-containing protein [Candidatus Latescibacterota bacterium]